MMSRLLHACVKAARAAPATMAVCLAMSCSTIPAGNAAGQTTLDRIAASKVIRIGFIGDQAPFAATVGGGTPQGYAVEICGEIAGAIGQGVGDARLTYVETTLADGFKQVAADQLDLLCGALTINLARREIVDFSEPIFLTGATAMLRTDSPRDLRELFLGERTISPPRSPELRPFYRSRIGVRSGTTTEAALNRAIADGGYSADVVSFPDHAAGLAALESREIDAYLADRALLVELISTASDPASLIIGSRLLTDEAYGIAMKRGEPDLRLLVDRALTKFYASPRFEIILEEYFGKQASAIRTQLLARAVPE